MSCIIGQKTLLNTLDTIKLPRFFMLHGEHGSGKKLICKHICESKELIYNCVENHGVDGIREVINSCVALSHPILFYIDGDKLTLQAQNALLKLLEEPPTKVYIAIGVTDINNVLETIRSRAILFNIDSYTRDELKLVFQERNLDTTYEDEIIDIATTPGQILHYINTDFQFLYDYVRKVYDNILKVSTGNAFKICNKIEFKDGDGIPLQLFLETFQHYVTTVQDGDIYVNQKMCLYTSSALQDLKSRGANKTLIFDIWVLNIRTLR